MIADMDGDCISELLIKSSSFDSLLIIDSKSGIVKIVFPFILMIHLILIL